MLTEAQVRRYARHILLPDVGGVGQSRLLAGAASVPVGGASAGAAICALAYLAAAGVGRLVLRGDPAGSVSADEIRAGILLAADDLGRPRGAAIAARVAAINPDVRVDSELYELRTPERELSEPRTSDLAVAVLVPVTEAELACEAGDLAGALIAGGAAAVRVLTQLARPQPARGGGL